MPKRSMDFDDFPDTDELQVKKKRKIEQSPEERLKEEAYNHQVRIVQLSHTDYPRFIQYLLDNENFLKYHISDFNKECLRRTCYTAWAQSNTSTFEDNAIFDRIFGPHIEPRYSFKIPVMGDDRKPSDDNNPYKLQIGEQVVWFTTSTYDAFWKWINNPDTVDKLRGRGDLTFKLQQAIERQKLRNWVLFAGRKEYEPADDATFERMIALTKEVKVDGE